MGNCCNKANEIEMNISTFGDSLTDSGRYSQVMSNKYCFKGGWYQYYMYEQFKTRDIESVIIDLGIGGQTVSEICARLPTAIPSNYITIMAGTNDVAKGIDNDPQTIAQHIIDTYKNTIPEAIKQQHEDYGENCTVIICSIPPVGKTSTVFTEEQLTGMADAIVIINEKLEAFVKEWGQEPSNILFCDTNRWLRGLDNRYIDNIYVSDGIHFNEYGKVICGQAISQKIVEHYYEWNQ